MADRNDSPPFECVDNSPALPPFYMDQRLYRFDSPLHRGTIVDRPNRFLLRVDFEGSTADVFLANPGVLSTVYAERREVLCTQVVGADRKTDYDAIAIRVDDIDVLVHTPLANDLFESALEQNLLDPFDRYVDYLREPDFPDHGRADFLLASETGDQAYVEVKSCTHVEDGIAKFPDSPTTRGRRHLRSLRAVVDDDTDAHVVFVIQRPDSTTFQPFAEVDPDFAELLEAARAAGVHLHAIEMTFDPPTVRLTETSVPIRFP